MKDRRTFFVRTAVSVFFLMGCARVNIQSDKPIKVDVTMRLDVYQHVAQDANAIENMISPKEEKSLGSNQSSFLTLGVVEAYAQEEGGYPLEVRDAIERRKLRRDDLVAWEAKGAIGENEGGMVEVRDSSLGGEEVSSLVEKENKDRRIIYQYVSEKNSATFEDTAKVFGKRIQEDAPVGTPIETTPGQWSKK